MIRKLAIWAILPGVLLAGIPAAEAQESPEALLSRLRFSLRLLQLSLEEPDGALFMPVQGVRREDVPDTWQAPRGGRRHEGQDILARKGTPVYSAAPGVLTQIGRDAMGGNILFVTGAGGRTYYYAHLDRFAAGMKKGIEVGTSTLLGYVGDTGNAEGGPAHLHFGIYTETAALDPLPLLVDR